MQSFNCAYIEMWKWQLLHQRILWPVFMDTAGSMILISVFLFAKEVGWEALVTKPYTDTDVLLASNWRTQKQWERWPIALFISLAQTLKCNRFWRYTSVISAEVNTSWTELQGKGSPPTYTLDKFWARKGIFCTVFPCQICTGLHKIYSYALLTEREVKMAIYWLSSFFFCVFMDGDEVTVHKKVEKERG